MSKVTKEETALATREEQSTELAPTAAVAEKQFEIQSAIIIARKFPRNEEQATKKLKAACKRTSFAEDAAYSYPRGGSTVTGPSVNIAREAARLWGNIRYGLYILRDDEESRQVRGWAYDVETNTKIEAEDDFKKVVERKGKRYLVTDERELRELTNRRGAILIRNCLLQLLPKDVIEDALAICAQTLTHQVEHDPDNARPKIILAFSEHGVTPEMLERKLGHPLSECTPREIADLRRIYTSIKDGHTTWDEHGGKPRAGERGTLSLEDLQPPPPEPDPLATTGTCDRSDFDQLEIKGFEAGVSAKKWHKHIEETMGISSWDLLPKERLREVQAWIAAQRK